MPVSLRFWNTNSYTYGGVQAATLTPSQLTYNYVSDSLNGQIGVAWQIVAGIATGTNNPFASNPSPREPDPMGSSVFGGFQQEIFTAETPVDSIRQSEAGVNVGQTLKVRLVLDFSKYDATAFNAPSAGLTYAGTVIGFSDFYSINSNQMITRMAFKGVLADGTLGTDLSSWRLFNSAQPEGNGGLGSGSTPWQSQEWIPGTGTLQGSFSKPPPFSNNGGMANLGGDTVMSMLTLSKTERYKYITIDITSDNIGGGADLFAVYAASARVNPLPNVSYKPHKIGYSPASVNKNGDTLNYGVTICNNEDFYLDDLTFQMNVPANTVLTSVAYDPKVVAGGPAVDAGVVTWRVPLNGQKCTTIQLAYTVFACPAGGVFNLAPILFLDDPNGLNAGGVQIPNKQVTCKGTLGAAQKKNTTGKNKYAHAWKKVMV